MSDPDISNWQKAHDIFESYVDLPLDEALKSLENNTHLSSEVKQLVKRLLNSFSSDATTLDNADLSFFETLSDEIVDLTGTNIGGYYLIEKIGEGGMAQVYRAKRIESTIQKFVAVKILTKKQKLSNELEQLFEKEQITLSKLSHSNIISFHHGGISDKGVPYLVMEYIEDAQKISRYCFNHNLNNRAIVQLILPIIDAVAYAHQQLIVHKDIKPGNILIDKQGKTYLLDFGISSLSEQQISADMPHIYTPDYASPEQFLKQAITTASDIFSMVATLLYLLTGKTRNTSMVQTPYNFQQDKQSIEAILNDSKGDHDLKNILHKGLSEKPQDRYHSAQQLKQDLDNWLNSRAVTATANTSLYLLKKLIKRNPWSSILVSGLAMGIVFSLAAMFVQKNHAELEAKKAKQVTDFLIESIQASDPDLTKGQEVSVKELLNNAKTKIQEVTLDDPLLASSLKQTIGLALAKIGQYQPSEKLLKQAIDTDKNNLTAQLNLVELYLQQQQKEQASKRFKFLQTQTAQMSKNQYVQLQQIQAKLLLLKGEFGSAINTINLVNTNNDITTKQAIENQLILADILDKKGDSKQAAKVLEETLVLSNKKLGKLSTTSTNISNRLADTLSNTNPVPYEKLFKIYQQTIQAQIQLYGEKHPLVAKTYLQYGFALKSNGKLKEAKKSANQAQYIATNQFGKNHILTAHINVLISQIEWMEGSINQAISTLKTVIPIYEHSYGKNHFETNQVKTTLALYLIKTGQGKQATEILLGLYDSQKQQLGENHQATMYVVLNLIKAYDLAGDFTKAISLGEGALVRSQQHLGDEFIITIGLQIALGKTYLHNKQPQKTINTLLPLLDMSIVSGNPSYHKRVALLLIQAYTDKQQYQLANQLIEKILTQYYANNEKPDEVYKQLILFKTN